MSSAPDPLLSAESVQSSEAATRSVEELAETLAGVELALARLDAGTYWTCEVTGEPLPDDLLVADPLARRRPAPAGEQPACLP
jgi:RNA polymerase-binding transcription factor DksA